jgi:hypothetical protein
MTSSAVVRVTSCALAAATVLTGCGGSSHAPAADATGTTAFTYDIVHRQAAGAAFAASDQAPLLSLAQTLCDSLDKGRSIAQLNDVMLIANDTKASPQEDARFVVTAVHTLCPKYASQLPTSSK